MKIMTTKTITTVLWVCIILLASLILFRLLQREQRSDTLENIKTVLTEKTLPVLKSTSQDIFPEQRQLGQNALQNGDF